MVLEKYITQRGNNERINPGDGIVPILQELSRGKLAVIGTGFYITRYGLFMTAYHVLNELTNQFGEIIHRGFILHLSGETKIHLRPILWINKNDKSDIAVGQAENYMKNFTKNPLMNLRSKLSSKTPSADTKVVTYAYPENKILDMTNKEIPPTIHGDYFDGVFLRYLSVPENPSMSSSYYETTIEIRSGASGGPVFNKRGQIIGVNCRGWDFRGTENEGNNLSYIIPINEAMNMKISHLQLPYHSADRKQLPKYLRGKTLTFYELAKFGHIVLD